MKERNFKIIRIVLWNLLPIFAIHILLNPFWDEKLGSDNTSLTLFEMAFTALIIPVYLLTRKYAWMDKARNIIAIGILMTFGIVLSALLHFANWANTVGSWNADRGTIAVIQLEFFVGFCIVALGTIVRGLMSNNRHSGAPPSTRAT